MSVRRHQGALARRADASAGESSPVVLITEMTEEQLAFAVGAAEHVGARAVQQARADVARSAQELSAVAILAPEAELESLAAETDVVVLAVGMKGSSSGFLERMLKMAIVERFGSVPAPKSRVSARGRRGSP